MNEEQRFLQAATNAVSAKDPRGLQRAIARARSRTSVETTQRLFREELPMRLAPDDLLWLLQEITDADGFAQRRDEMIDALCDDLCRYGYVPGIDFSIAPDARTGRAVHLKSKVWDTVCENLSPRSVQHYRVFVCLGD